MSRATRSLFPHPWLADARDSLSELCSLDQPNHSFQAYAVSVGDEQITATGAARASWKETSNMNHIANKPVPKLRNVPQPPLSHAGAIPDSDRAKRPPLSEPSPTGLELTPGDRVEGLGNFGKPTGELGTVQQTNDDDALVKWDDDGRTRLQQLRLRKTSKQGSRLAKSGVVPQS